MIKENITFGLGNENVRSRRSVIDVHARLWMSACLFTTDMLSLCAALLIAIEIRGDHQLITSSSYKELFVLLAIAISILFYRRGLYPAVGMHYVDELRHIVSSTALAYLILIGITFLLQTTLIYSRLVLLMAGILSMLLIPLYRYVIRNLLISSALWGEPSIIIGDAHLTRPLMDYFKLNLQLGIRPVAALSDKPLTFTDYSECPIQPLCNIKLFARKYSVTTALVLMDNIEDAHALVEKYRFIFHRVILIKDQEHNFALTSLRTLDFLNILGLQVKNDLLSDSSRITKRILDILGSFLGLLVVSPFLGLVAILIKLDSRGAVFYRQPRVGKHGTVFYLLKFRTMYVNADQIFKEALENDLKLKHEWTTYQKLRNDPRITRLGGFLRKFSIDELPQLWNVLVGQMSLVGPRPFMLGQRKLYGEYIKNYIRVLPGMTGLWQVSGRNETTFVRRASLDREYIQRWSLWLDIYIIMKTVKIVFFEKTAY